MAETVTLVSNDKEGEAKTLTVNRKAIELSVTVKNLLQEMPEDDDSSVGPIPLPNVSGPVLEKVIEYVTHYYENPDPEAEKRTEAERRSAEIPEWDKNFCAELNMEGLFNLILAANYLDIKSLLDLTCKTVANMIKGKTPEEIKTLFGVTREFTPEEEEQVKRENPWLVETK
jgi:S-phase kinase-associated protein 1